MDRRERIEQLRGKGLDNLTGDELAELNGLVAAEVSELRGAERTSDNVADIRTFVGIASEVTAEDDRRAEAENALNSEADELLAQFDGGRGEGEGNGEGNGDGAGEGAGEGEGNGEGASDGGQQPEGIAASAGAPAVRPRRAQLRSARQPQQPQQAAARDSEGAPIAIVASLDGQRNGAPVNGLEIAQSIGSRLDQIHRSGFLPQQDGQKLHVAGASYMDRFGDRVFTGDADENTAILDRLAADARNIGNLPNREAVLASGGVCAIYPMDYTFETIGSQDRPVRAALPSGGAPRGGVRFYKPPLYDASIYSQGVRQWTYANDAAVDPADDTTWKPCIEFDCGVDDTAELYAVTQCAEISNLRAKFNPENVAANLYYLGVAHSSLGDSLLLNTMVGKSRYVSEAGQVSALRDLLTYLDVSIASARDRYRLPISQAMHIMLPHWAREVLRIDMLRSAFPDDLGVSRFAITDAQINAWFASRNVAVTWLLDAFDSTQAVNSGGAQGSTTIGSPTALHMLPNTVKFLLYVEGTFTFLDGGDLDLGVTRDSSLNRRNRFQVFMETFEGIVMRGVQSEWHSAVLTANGASVGTIAPPAYAATL